MDQHFLEMKDLEERIYSAAIRLLDDFGPAGVLALEHTLKRIQDYRAPAFPVEGKRGEPVRQVS